MTEEQSESRRVVALAGGVGGAKLAHGLAMASVPERLSVVVNTADDFSLYGLHISPDLDTVTYTLSGLANPETGWGIAGDTFNTLEMIRRYGRDTWFWLGDRDFATHILRTERLRAGESLSAVATDLAFALGIASAIIPMSDDPVATLIRTADGLLDFQDYFVRRQHQDDVLGIELRGIEEALLSPAADSAFAAAETIVLCPSNPIVSIGPILALPGVRDRLCALGVPIIAVSPIINGQALKGPADHMLATLGHDVSAFGVAEIYRDFLSGIVIDRQDAGLAGRIEAMGIAVRVADTIMRNDEDRRALAAVTLEFAEQLRG